MPAKEAGGVAFRQTDSEIPRVGRFFEKTADAGCWGVGWGGGGVAGRLKGSFLGARNVLELVSDDVCTL